MKPVEIKKQLSIQILLDWSYRHKVLDFIEKNLDLIANSSGIDRVDYQDFKKAIYQAWYALIIAHHFKLNNYTKKILVDALLFSTFDDIVVISDLLMRQDIYHNKDNYKVIINLINNRDNDNYNGIFNIREKNKNNLYLLLLSIVRDVNLLTGDEINIFDRRFNNNISCRLVGFATYVTSQDIAHKVAPDEVSRNVALKN